MTALSSGTLASRMSRPISRYAGPGAPASASRKAMEHMSATRSVVRTLDANFVIGFMRSTCGRSCSEPILCWLSAPWPPISSIGLSARSAFAIPVTASVVPGAGAFSPTGRRPVHVVRQIQRMLPDEALGELGVASLEGLDDVHVVDDGALRPVFLPDHVAANRAHV